MEMGSERMKKMGGEEIGALAGMTRGLVLLTASVGPAGTTDQTNTVSFPEKREVLVPTVPGQYVRQPKRPDALSAEGTG